MFKRFLSCFLAIPFLLVPLPVSAWNNQSFIGNDYSSSSFDISVSSPQHISPNSVSSDSGSSDGIYSGADFVSLLSMSPLCSYAGVEVIDWHAKTDYVDETSFYRVVGGNSVAFSSSGSSVSFSTSSIPVSTSYDYLIKYVGLITDDSLEYFPNSSLFPSVGYNRVAVSVDLSSFDDISDIELVGSVSLTANYAPAGFNSGVVSGGSCTLSVNGSLTDVSFSSSDGLIQFNNYLYSSSVPITQFELVFYVPSFNATLYTTSQNFTWDVSLDFSDSQFSFISGSSGGVVDTDKVQGEITEHEDIESQWGGSMTENFDALDIENFSYPDGLASAFSLISGIFQDFWYGMGEYGILYVFPLTLAIMLLVIGRLSKFAGRSKSDKGGDD